MFITRKFGTFNIYLVTVRQSSTTKNDKKSSSVKNNMQLSMFV
jgi:hypothetical protein